MMHQFQLPNLSATNNLAHAIAKAIVPNFVITLNGNLGAGKTTLVREILRALGVDGSIKSPTFTLVEPYNVNNMNVFHFDLYRFSDPEEWFDAGFDEYFSHPQISFIEWAEKARELIPHVDWQINIEVDDECRQLTILTNTVIGEECLTNLINSDAIY